MVVKVSARGREGGTDAEVAARWFDGWMAPHIGTAESAGSSFQRFPIV